MALASRRPSGPHWLPMFLECLRLSRSHRALGRQSTRLTRQRLEMLAERVQDGNEPAGLCIRDMRVGLQDDLGRLLQKLAGAERADFVVAKHRGAEDDTQADVVGLVRLGQNAMQFLQQRVSDNGGTFEG